MARKRDDRLEPDAEAGAEPFEQNEGEETEGRGRSKRKRATHAITDLGVELVGLPADKLAALPLPERLREAIDEARRLTSFGAQRRQALFIGKLMRKLDDDTLPLCVPRFRSTARGRRARRRRCIARSAGVTSSSPTTRRSSAGSASIPPRTRSSYAR